MWAVEGVIYAGKRVNDFLGYFVEKPVINAKFHIIFSYQYRQWLGTEWFLDDVLAQHFADIIFA